MSQKKRDHELGMHCPISRRDFLNGAALTIGGAAIRPSVLSSLAGGEDAPEKSLNYYPPALTGMRGNHDGSFASAHHLRDAQKWDASGPSESTSEFYDLVVVGGGISGLAAAYFFRKRAGISARILILDNHDDFGGHAKRNEFRAGARTLLSYGGTQSIESPGEYSEVSKGLVEELGIDVASYPRLVDRKLYSSRGLARK